MGSRLAHLTLCPGCAVATADELARIGTAAANKHVSVPVTILFAPTVLRGVCHPKEGRRLADVSSSHGRQGGR